LYYEEERQKAGGRSGTRTDLVPNLAQGSEETGKTNEILAKKAGVGKSNMAYLIAVYRNRPDLFELVFEGSYSVNKAYTQMKADEQPDEPTEEATVTLDARKLVAETLERNSSAPRYDDSLPASDPHNVVVDMREQVMSMTNEVLHRSKTINATKGDVKKSAREQLMALTRSCVIALGETSEKDDDSEILYVCLELLQKLEGGDK
jgi:hypothetical protein